jgi:ribose 5-phosphate isomerase
MEWSSIKNAIGEFCAAMVPKSGLIGLGSGTTSVAFIHALAQRCQDERLAIRCVPTSIEIERLATSVGLNVIGRDWADDVDITFDGADAVDNAGTAIKGAGGALVREKIVARSSKKLVLMIDERKMGRPWHECLLPVAVLPFGLSATMKHIGLSGTVRMNGNRPYITDDGLCIIDVALPLRVSLSDLDHQLKSIPGVVETGIFFHIATEIVIGYGDGKLAQVSL